MKKLGHFNANKLHVTKDAKKEMKIVQLFVDVLLTVVGIQISNVSKTVFAIMNAVDLLAVLFVMLKMLNV